MRTSGGAPARAQSSRPSASSASIAEMPFAQHGFCAAGCTAAPRLRERAAGPAPAINKLLIELR